MTAAEKTRVAVLRRELEKAARSFLREQRDASVCARAPVSAAAVAVGLQSDRAHYVLGYLLAGAGIDSAQFDEWSGVAASYPAAGGASSPLTLPAPTCEHVHCTERTDVAHSLCPLCADVYPCPHCEHEGIELVCDCLECENRARALASHKEQQA